MSSRNCTCYWISVIIHKTIFASEYIQYDPVECGGFRINTQASTPPNSFCTSKRDNWNNRWVASSTTAVSHHGNQSPVTPNNILIQTSNRWVASSTTAVSHHGNKSPLTPNNTLIQMSNRTLVHRRMSTTAVSHHGNQSPLTPNNTLIQMSNRFLAYHRIPHRPSCSVPLSPYAILWEHVHRVPAQAIVPSVPAKDRAIQRQ